MFGKILTILGLSLGLIGIGQGVNADIPKNVKTRIMNINQQTPLVLYQGSAIIKSDEGTVISWHSSHRSHYSHYSHRSHSSHYSSY